jgi:hypothetical protein
VQGGETSIFLQKSVGNIDTTVDQSQSNCQCYGPGGIAPPAWLISLFMVGMQVQTKVENAFFSV